VALLRRECRNRGGYPNWYQPRSWFSILLCLVWLEIISAFSFQPGNWLGEVAPILLADEMRAGLEAAKQKALLREVVESAIPGTCSMRGTGRLRSPPGRRSCSPKCGSR